MRTKQWCFRLRFALCSLLVGNRSPFRSQSSNSSPPGPVLSSTQTLRFRGTISPCNPLPSLLLSSLSPMKRPPSLFPSLPPKTFPSDSPPLPLVSLFAAPLSAPLLILAYPSPIAVTKPLSLLPAILANPPFLLKLPFLYLHVLASILGRNQLVFWRSSSSRFGRLCFGVAS